MKVDVSWGARKTNVTYNVSAADLEGALKFLKTREEWGAFVGSCPFKSKGNTKTGITFVSLQPTYSITMPSWRAYTKQPQECKDAWDAMFKALREHEDGHRDLFEAWVKSLATDLEALDGATTADIKERIRSAATDMQSQSDAYDKTTDHGASRGVELNITPSCRSKTKAR
jgi:predicted secreted Zn-dependent protease